MKTRPTFQHLKYIINYEEIRFKFCWMCIAVPSNSAKRSGKHLLPISRTILSIWWSRMTISIPQFLTIAISALALPFTLPLLDSSRVYSPKPLETEWRHRVYLHAKRGPLYSFILKDLPFTLARPLNLSYPSPASLKPRLQIQHPRWHEGKTQTKHEWIYV